MGWAAGPCNSLWLGWTGHWSMMLSTWAGCGLQRWSSGGAHHVYAWPDPDFELDAMAPNFTLYCLITHVTMNTHWTFGLISISVIGAVQQWTLKSPNWELHKHDDSNKGTQITESGHTHLCSHCVLPIRPHECRDLTDQWQFSFHNRESDLRCHNDLWTNQRKS